MTVLERLDRKLDLGEITFEEWLDGVGQDADHWYDDRTEREYAKQTTNSIDDTTKPEHV